jgi:hypothetical protein
MRVASPASLLACCLTRPHRGNIARSALAGQGAAAVSAARFALLCQCSPPTTTAIVCTKNVAAITRRKYILETKVDPLPDIGLLSLLSLNFGPAVAHMRVASPASLLACCFTYPHRGNIARSALAGQGAAAVSAARFALLCQCSPLTTTAIARPRSGLYCRLSTDLLLFAFVHAGCAHVDVSQ